MKLPGNPFCFALESFGLGVHTHLNASCGVCAVKRVGCRRRAGVVVLLAALLFLPGLTLSQGVTVDNPYKVKAAFLRNFAHYVVWPEYALPAGNAPWCIGILGPDPFGDILETTLRGRTEQGRTFVIVRAATLEELPPCQIVFMTYPDTAKRRAALAVLKQKPILTVSDEPEFLPDGGVIGFEVTDRVRMSINLDQARAVSLAIQTKMLEVSSEILENGEMRRMR
ncbi:YfiR family protein [Methylomonas methanica]|uniref:YfiR family protein n=1 Tax=Methylomonas methanica TaxID=421 RepID=UPI0009EEF1A0|nr:YfiR family protein [Methylomonas methanica]